MSASGRIRAGEVVYLRCRVESVHADGDFPHGNVLLMTVDEKGGADEWSLLTWVWDRHVLTSREIAEKAMGRKREGSG